MRNEAEDVSDSIDNRTDRGGVAVFGGVGRQGQGGAGRAAAGASAV